MDKIKIMSEDLANKIAAGEVIERPMNVVKELVENSVDAESTEISIILEDAGIKEITVVDNGTGMSKNDAINSFNRHATSKLKTLKDLFNINTLGFRGEAIPSIAAVSDFTMKTSDGSVGTLIHYLGGKEDYVKDTDIRKGTSITVKNLFYNTPVRLKYLKNVYTELSHITDYINKMALSYPNIKFSLINNNKTILKTDGSNRLLKVINDIYGVKVTTNMMDISGESDDYKITGYISKPEMVKGSKSSINILVNGRVIKNNEITRTVIDAYHTYVHKGQYPIVVLNIEVDPSLIDINIHPTKLDIKFSKFEDLTYLINETIVNKLNTKDLVQVARDKVDLDKVETKVSNHYATVNIKDEFDEEAKEKEFESISFDFEVKDEDIPYSEECIPKIKDMEPIGCIHETYIVCQNEDGMYLIDQHAAEERYNYERFLEILSNKKKDQIDLLIPINIELPYNEYIILKEHFNYLDELGITYEEFGINTIIVRSLPVWIPEGKEETSVRVIIDTIVENENFDIKKYIDSVAMMVACRTSIQAHDYLSLEDMKLVIKHLQEAKNPYTCPHGRPTIISYSNYDLERLFKRAM